MSSLGLGPRVRVWRQDAVWRFRCGACGNPGRMGPDFTEAMEMSMTHYDYCDKVQAVQKISKHYPKKIILFTEAELTNALIRAREQGRVSEQGTDSSGYAKRLRFTEWFALRPWRRNDRAADSESDL